MSTNSSALGDFLFGQTRGRIFALLFGRSDQSFYIRQIARETQSSAGSVRRELEALAHVGLIQRTNSGHQVYYQANRTHPVFAELQSLVAHTVQPVDVYRNPADSYSALAAALARFGSLVSLAFLYKSTISARDPEENSAASLDLMIVGDVRLDEIRPLIEPVERQMGCSIEAAIFSAERFDSRLREGSRFFQSIMEGERVILIGQDPGGSKSPDNHD